MDAAIVGIAGASAVGGMVVGVMMMGGVVKDKMKALADDLAWHKERVGKLDRRWLDLNNKLVIVREICDELKISGKWKINGKDVFSRTVRQVIDSKLPEQIGGL